MSEDTTTITNIEQIVGYRYDLIISPSEKTVSTLPVSQLAPCLDFISQVIYKKALQKLCVQLNKDYKRNLYLVAFNLQKRLIETEIKNSRESIDFSDILQNFDLNNLSTNLTDIVAIGLEVQNYGAVYDKSFPFIMLRKSNANQSNVDLLLSIKGFRCRGFLLAVDSSGFDDSAILRALKLCVEYSINELKVEMALGSSRSIYATATRNPSIATALVTYSRLLGIEIDIGGSILGVNGAIFKLMVSLQGSSEWLGNANTNHSAKHHDYFEYLKLTPIERLSFIKTCTPRFKQEMEVFIEKNGSEEKVRRFLIGMLDRPSYTINKNGKHSVFCSTCYREEFKN